MSYECIAWTLLEDCVVTVQGHRLPAERRGGVQLPQLQFDTASAGLFTQGWHSRNEHFMMHP